MILGRPLTAAERRKSQRLYGAFNFGNGMSYMCLGENLLVLFATQLGAPNAVIALLGAGSMGTANTRRIAAGSRQEKSTLRISRTEASTIIRSVLKTL